MRLPGQGSLGFSALKKEGVVSEIQSGRVGEGVSERERGISVRR